MRHILAAAFLGLVLAACSEEAPPAPVPDAADTIYHRGPILTVDDNYPNVEAVAVKDGRIQAVGSDADVMAFKGNATEVVDLRGRTLVPGFIDAHGHMALVGALSPYVDIASPPVGTVTDIESLKAALAERRDAGVEDTGVEDTGGWILGFGYDDSLLAEKRHPSRADLDAVSTEHPILLLHVSLHLAAANSKALELIGIDETTPDPDGGVIRRIAGTDEPDGVLEEHAMFLAMGALPQPTPERRVELVKNAARIYARNGITTAQDGATQPADFAALKAAAGEHSLIIDVVAYPTWMVADTLIGSDEDPGIYHNRLKIGGVKLVLDGSPQGKTAWLSAPYHVVPEGQPDDYHGYPALPDDEVNSRVADYYAKGWQILAHANGDAAAEQLITAVEKAEAAHPGKDRRTVMIHAQTVRDDQLDRMKKLGMIPSFFTAHTLFWGDWHRDSVLGPDRATRISPARSAIDRGVVYTFHNDSPVVPPHMTRLMWTGVNRITRAGQVLGPDQRVTPREALEAVTINAAYQNFEENIKGSITPGKVADLVILSDNPLTVDPLEIDDIAVVETIKDGQAIYRAER